MLGENTTKKGIVSPFKKESRTGKSKVPKKAQMVTRAGERTGVLASQEIWNLVLVVDHGTECSKCLRMGL